MYLLCEWENWRSCADFFFLVCKSDVFVKANGDVLIFPLFLLECIVLFEVLTHQVRKYN